MEKKICNKCGQERSLDEFHVNKRNKDGHKSECKLCSKKIAVDKNWKKLNQNKVKEYREKYKETRNKLERELRLNDPNYRFKSNIRLMIRKTFKRNNYSKNSKTHAILGCSYEEFKLHLESKFLPWMNWENKGLYNSTPNFGWDIDHIEPLANAKTEDDIIRLNHYTNLQPLCSYINRDIKKNK